MKVKMEYYVIFKISIGKSCRRNIGNVKPSALRSERITVSEDTPTEETKEFVKSYRKYVGFMSREKFLKLLEEMDYAANDKIYTCETLGMMTDAGMLPAVFVSSDADGYSLGMYVCPAVSAENVIVFTKQLTTHPQKEIVMAEFGAVQDRIMADFRHQIEKDRGSLPDILDFDVENLRLDLKTA